MYSRDCFNEMSFLAAAGILPAPWKILFFPHGIGEGQDSGHARRMPRRTLRCLRFSWRVGAPIARQCNQFLNNFDKKQSRYSSLEMDSSNNSG